MFRSAWRLGNWAFFTSSTCHHGNPALYNLTLAWIIIGFIAIGLPALVLAGFIFCFPIIFLFMRILVRLAPERFTQVLGGVTANQIEKHTKTEIYKPGMFDADHNQCGICLADYVEEDKLRVLPCSHCYHSNCVDSWLKLKATCPTCRSHIITGRQEEDESRQHRVLTPQSSNRAGSMSNANANNANNNQPSTERQTSSGATAQGLAPVQPSASTHTDSPTRTHQDAWQEGYVAPASRSFIGHTNERYSPRYTAPGSNDYFGSDGSGGLAWRLQPQMEVGRHHHHPTRQSSASTTTQQQRQSQVDRLQDVELAQTSKPTTGIR
jgi:hypothetical protein